MYLFSDWYVEKYGQKADFSKMPVGKMAEDLRRFYCEARPVEKKNKSTQNEYTKNTLLSIRAGINRYVQELGLGIDIVRDKEFIPANKALRCIFKDQRRRGVMPVSIAETDAKETDLIQMASYLARNYNTSPVVLRQAMWFNLLIYFPSNCRDISDLLLRDDLEIKADKDGKEYVTLTQAARDRLSPLSGCNALKECRMDSIPGGPLCPVKLTRFYLQRLDPLATHLFNKIDKNPLQATGSLDVWFKPKPMAKYLFTKIMYDIEGCSNQYTTRCLKAGMLNMKKKYGELVALRRIYGLPETPSVVVLINNSSGPA